MGIFHFFNSNLNFEFGSVWYRPKPEPDRTGPVPTGFINSGHDRHGEQNRMAEDNKERERAGYLAYL